MSSPSAATYARHDPTKTALHALVLKHLETFLQWSEERSGAPLPRYVVEELRAYLRCGVLAHGFGRARCAGCGHDILVAFSCKRRGACPSCGGRRMSETAADLVDCVFPDVPVRQWVLSLPFGLRQELARDPALLTFTSRVFFEEMRRWYRAASGVVPDHDHRVETGGVTHVQRWGGSLNLNVHFHVAMADGAWRCPTDGTSPTFIATRCPTREDLAGVVALVARRIAAKLSDARGDDSAGDGAAVDGDPLDGCRRAATARGSFGTVRGDRAEEKVADDGAARFGRRPPKAQVAEFEGFNLHAGVVIGAKDREGRERLLRYMARPAVVLDRVTELDDGRVAWRLKLPGSRGDTHRIMDPMEFMARLAALVPPPRFPLVRYHGTFAPNSPWRAAIVPGPRRSMTPCAGAATPEVASRSAAQTVPAENPAPTSRPGDAKPIDPADVIAAALDGSRTDGTERVAKSRPGLSRMDWATLLKRVWGVDILQCERCPGRLRFIAVIQERSVIVRILDHLGLPSEPVVAAPARRWDDTS